MTTKRKKKARRLLNNLNNPVDCRVIGSETFLKEAVSLLLENYINGNKPNKKQAKQLSDFSYQMMGGN